METDWTKLEDEIRNLLLDKLEQLVESAGNLKPYADRLATWAVLAISSRNLGLLKSLKGQALLLAQLAKIETTIEVIEVIEDVLRIAVRVAIAAL